MKSLLNFASKRLLEQLKRCLCFLYELRKRRCIVYCKVCKHFSVQVDFRNFQTVHKLAVRNAVDSRRRVDSGNPKTTEISLSSSSADVRIVQRLHNRFSCDSVRFALIAKVTFCKF